MIASCLGQRASRFGSRYRSADGRPVSAGTGSAAYKGDTYNEKVTTFNDHVTQDVSPVGYDRVPGTE